MALFFLFRVGKNLPPCLCATLFSPTASSRARRKRRRFNICIYSSGGFTPTAREPMRSEAFCVQGRVRIVHYTSRNLKSNNSIIIKSNSYTLSIHYTVFVQRSPSSSFFVRIRCSGGHVWTRTAVASCRRSSNFEIAFSLRCRLRRCLRLVEMEFRFGEVLLFVFFGEQNGVDK